MDIHYNNAGFGLECGDGTDGIHAKYRIFLRAKLDIGEAVSRRVATSAIEVALGF